MGFDLDFDYVHDLAQGYLDAAIAGIPRVLLGLLVIWLGLRLARRAAGMAERAAVRGKVQPSAAQAMGRIAFYATLVGGFLVGLATFVPSFDVAGVIQLLGVGGVAIGFAFRDILQNFLAGLIILVTEPFCVGDLIIVAGYEGEVEAIRTRATTMRTYDGTQVVIPNATVFSESVTVLTAYDERRWSYDFEIGYADDLEQAREIVLQAMADSDLVLRDPEPAVYTLSLNESGVGIRAYWWVAVPDTNPLLVWDEVVRVVRDGFEAAGVEIPYPTRSVLVAGRDGGDGEESDAALGA